MLGHGLGRLTQGGGGGGGGGRLSQSSSSSSNSNHRKRYEEYGDDEEDEEDDADDLHMLPETQPAPLKRKTNGAGRPLGGGGGGGGRGRGGWVRRNGHWQIPVHEPIDRKWMQADAQVRFGLECVGIREG